MRALLIASEVGAAIRRSISASSALNGRPSRRLTSSITPIGAAAVASGAHRRLLRDESADFIAGAPDARIGRGVGDDLRRVLGDGEADDALPDRQAHAGHVDRADADAAFEHARRRIEQEQRCAFGLHEIGDAR